MYIYAFGSVCRGEIDLGSDIDLLAIVDGYDERFDPNLYSIYTLSRVSQIWKQGNPFAWHLSMESKLLFSEDKKDILKELGKPEKYTNTTTDCTKFYTIFSNSVSSIQATNDSIIFDLSTIFLAIRNFATCYSLGMTNTPDFSRNSARRLNSNSIPISNESYKIYERSRILCTRGYGEYLSLKEIDIAKKEIPKINSWMINLIKSIGKK